MAELIDVCGYRLGEARSEGLARPPVPAPDLRRRISNNQWSQFMRRKPLLGVLSPGFPGGSTAILDGLVSALAKLGITAGTDIDIECRYARQSHHLLSESAEELRQLNTDILIGGRSPEARQCMIVEPEKPVLVALAGDPIGLRLAQSFENPGWNLTGACCLSPALSRMQLDVIRSADPEAAVVGVVWDLADFERTRELFLLRDAADALGIELAERPVRSTEDIPSVLDDLKTQAAWNIVFGGLSTLLAAAKIVEASIANGVETLFPLAAFIDAGGTMALEPKWDIGLSIVAGQILEISEGRDVARMPFQFIEDATLMLAGEGSVVKQVAEEMSARDGVDVSWKR